jgi:diguanylate cyclase
MFKRNTEKSEQQWKAKYFNSLEELETKEKHWTVLDEAMRKSLSRMSVLINGVDRQLDKELDYLRLSIRKGAEGKKIRAILETVFTTLEKVESQRSKRKRLSPAEAYELLLDRLVLPKGTARKVKGLKKSISRLGEDDSPTDVIREFEELMRYSFSLIKEDVGKQQGAENTDRITTEKTVIENTLAEKPKTESPPAMQEQMGRLVLQELMSKLVLPDDQQRDVKAVQQRLQSASLEAELSRLASQLASIINDAVTPAQVDEILQGDDSLTINEVLLQLLEKIELPADVNDEVTQIQHQLEGDVSQHEWPDLLERISRLIRTMREKANEEKKSLESFLAQLTEQLQTLDNFISGVEKDHHESIHEGQALSDRMQDHIQHIGRSVDDAAELEQLKDAVRIRLETVSQHMTEFRNYEELRDVRAQERIDELNARIKSMEEDSEKLRNKVKQERESALMDQLTEVRNRMAYDERIEQEHARWKRYQSPLSLIVIDIDLFKKINDNFGHIAGDKVLHTVAQNLQQNIRETDFLARYGGEEFVIIMPDTHAQEGLAVAEKLRAAVEDCGFHYRGDSVQVTISCGIAEFSHNDTPGKVFEKADAAMYRAKAEGRNRCLVS